MGDKRFSHHHNWLEVFRRRKEDCSRREVWGAIETNEFNKIDTIDLTRRRTKK